MQLFFKMLLFFFFFFKARILPNDLFLFKAYSIILGVYANFCRIIFKFTSAVFTYLCPCLGTASSMSKLQKFLKIVLVLLFFSEAKEANILHFSVTTGYVSNFYVLLIYGTAPCLSYSSMRIFRFLKESPLQL